MPAEDGRVRRNTQPLAQVWPARLASAHNVWHDCSAAWHALRDSGVHVAVRLASVKDRMDERADTYVSLKEKHQRSCNTLKKQSYTGAGMLADLEEYQGTFR